jgi:hypothetical protein
MNATIVPVYTSQIQILCDAFFGKKYELERLGQPGRWIATSPIRYAAPEVERRQFDALLRARGEQGLRSPDAPVAWHFRFDPDRVANTLWALADKTTRTKIESIHSFSAALVPAVIGCHLTEGMGGFLRPRILEGFSFASFTSGTDVLGAPSLHTDTFLMNRAFEPRTGRVRAFPNEKIVSLAAWVNRIYSKTFASYLTCEIGHFDAVAVKMIEQPTFHISQLASPNGDPTRGRENRGREDVFLAWQEAATAHGFGPDKVEAVLRYARERRATVDTSHVRAFLEKTKSFADSIAKAPVRLPHQELRERKHGRSR